MSIATQKKNFRKIELAIRLLIWQSEECRQLNRLFHVGGPVLPVEIVSKRY